jgi:hypothetical protein
MVPLVLHTFVSSLRHGLVWCDIKMRWAVRVMWTALVVSLRIWVAILESHEYILATSLGFRTCLFYFLCLVRLGMMHMVFSNYAFKFVCLTMKCFWKSTHAATRDEMLRIWSLMFSFVLKSCGESLYVNSHIVSVPYNATWEWHLSLLSLHWPFRIHCLVF